MARPGAVTRKRKQRVDAERSAAVILDAAVRLLGERPDASMNDIAQAAGVTRPTVYAHYASREALIEAALLQATEATVAAIDAADPERGPARDALVRVLDAIFDALARYPMAWHAGDAAATSASGDLHDPISARLERLVRRGQRSGAFDRKLPPGWLVTAFVALGHAAGSEVAAGRMTVDEAASAVRRSVLNLFAGDRSRELRE